MSHLSTEGFASECYLLTEGTHGVLIDASASLLTVKDALSKAGAALDAILLTHGHFDHMLTLEDIKKATGAAVYLGKEDASFPADGEKNAYAAFFGTPRVFPNPDCLLNGGETLVFGPITCKVMHTPGHTPGSLTYLVEDMAFTGDTLFNGSYGRCDLYGGDFARMKTSLKTLSALPPRTKIYPGHGGGAFLSSALLPLSHII